MKENAAMNAPRTDRTDLYRNDEKVVVFTANITYNRIKSGGGKDGCIEKRKNIHD